MSNKDFLYDGGDEVKVVSDRINLWFSHFPDYTPQNHKVTNMFINWCNDRFGDTIGKGIDRLVWQCGSDLCIKVIRGYLGVYQNKAEVDFYKKYTSTWRKTITPSIFDWADDYSWIISEMVAPFKLSKLKDWGIGLAPFMAAIKYMLYKTGLDIKVIINREKRAHFQKYGDDRYISETDYMKYGRYDSVDSCIRRYKSSFDLCRDDIPNFRTLTNVILSGKFNITYKDIDELFAYNEEKGFRNLGLSKGLGDDFNEIVLLDTGLIDYDNPYQK